MGFFTKIFLHPHIRVLADINDILIIMAFSGCGSLQPIGGHADVFIDFLLNEVRDKK